MTGLLPPAALSARLGGLERIAAAHLADEPIPISRERPREYAALSAAIERSGSPTPCAADPRFTADRARELSEADVGEMRAACRACTVRPECDTYARAARPPAGYWAGEQYPRPQEAAR